MDTVGNVADPKEITLNIRTTTVHVECRCRKHMLVRIVDEKSAP